MRIYEAINNTPYERASFAATNATGQTHSYQVMYNPQTGVLQVARDGVALGSWTDTTPLASGGFLSLRTDGSSVQFDDIAVSEVIKYYYLGGQRVATPAPVAAPQAQVLVCGGVARYTTCTAIISAAPR